MKLSYIFRKEPTLEQMTRQLRSEINKDILREHLVNKGLTNSQVKLREYLLSLKKSQRLELMDKFILVQ